MAKTASTLRQAIPMYVANQPEPWRDDVHSKLGALLGIAEAFDNDALKIAADGDLSLTGRFRRLADAVHGALDQIKAFRTTVVQKFRDRLAATEVSLLSNTTPKRPDDLGTVIANEFRLAEIRAELRPLSQEVRLDVARHTDDPLVFDAVLTAGPVLVPAKPGIGSQAGTAARLQPFIDPKARQALLLARAAAADPAAARLHKDLTEAVKTFDLAVSILNTAITAEMPAAPPAVPGQVKENFKDPATGKPLTMPAAK